MARVKEQMDAGKIGKVLAIAATNQGSMPGGWFIDKTLSGGGALLDHTVHVADLVRWFTGAEFADVYAEADTLFHDIGVEDSGLLSFSMTDGTICTLDCSWSRLPHYPTWGGVTLNILGTDGYVSVDAFGQTLALYTEQPRDGVDSLGQQHGCADGPGLCAAGKQRPASRYQRRGWAGCPGAGAGSLPFGRVGAAGKAATAGCLTKKEVANASLSRCDRTRVKHFHAIS